MISGRCRGARIAFTDVESNDCSKAIDKKRAARQGLLVVLRERSSRRQEAPPQGSVFQAVADQVQVMRPFAEDEQVLLVSE